MTKSSLPQSIYELFYALYLFFQVRSTVAEHEAVVILLLYQNMLCVIRYRLMNSNSTEDFNRPSA